MTRGKRGIWLVVAALALAAPPAGAAPEPAEAADEKPAKLKIALLRFKGARGELAHTWVANELRKHKQDYEVVTRGRVQAAQRPKDARARSTLFRTLKTDAVIYGSAVVGKNGWQLELFIARAPGDAEPERIEYTGDGARALQAELRSKLRKDVDGVLRDDEPETLIEASPYEAAAAEAKAQQAAAAPAAAAPAKQPRATKPAAAPAKAPKKKRPAKAKKRGAAQRTAKERARQRKPPPDATPEPAPEEAPARAAAAPEHVAEAPPLELMLAVRGYSRKLEYHQDLQNRLRTPQLGAAPSAALEARWYPLAHSRGGVLAHLGVVGSYEQGFLTSLTDFDGRELDVNMRAWSGGVRGRLPIGRQELGLTLSYGQHNFEVDTSRLRAAPDANYQFLRPGLDARFRVNQILFGFHFGYRHLLTAGDLESSAWFPRLTGAGLDAGVFVGQQLSAQWDVLAGFDMRRYYFDMHARPGDANVAGGAVDQYLALWLGLSWRWPSEQR